MKSFRQFLAEARDKNVHLEHLEDEVLNKGIDGTRQSINFLRSLRDMLAGHSKSKVNVTVKWDGAPAVFCGKDPLSGRFFVGTKSIFNKTPKLNFTSRDIDKNHPSPGLNEKLKIALKELKKLNIDGILQGDMMFTKQDLKKKTIGGEKFLTFQPNTILYAIPINSKLASEIKAAQMGIVFHTSYSGPSIQELKASFNVNVDSLKKSARVWIRDADYRDESGSATMTENETKEVTAILSQAGKLFRRMDSSVVNMIAQDDELRMLVKTFTNSKIRQGQLIGDVRSHTNGLVSFITKKFEDEIDKLKTERGQNSRRQKLEKILSRIRRNKKQLMIMFEMMNLLQQAKIIIVRKLEKIQGIGTFIQTADGFKVTAPEGFVAVDRLGGGAVKLVDRLEFSRSNFNAQKNWTN